jgi:hypothetical protein
MSTQATQSDSHLPKRIKHSYTQSIHAPPAEVFPLLCPIRELDWAPGWTVDWVISNSGLAEQECLFQTPAPQEADSPSIWIITRHVAEDFEVEMYKVTPGKTVAKLQIALAARGDSGTSARISYELTSLGSDGDAFLQEFTEQWYENFMQGWESAMNHYLKTGEMLAA